MRIFLPSSFCLYPYSSVCDDSGFGVLNDLPPAAQFERAEFMCDVELPSEIAGISVLLSSSSDGCNGNPDCDSCVIRTDRTVRYVPPPMVYEFSMIE